VVLRNLKKPPKTYGSKYPIFGRIKIWLFLNLALVFIVLALARPQLSEFKFNLATSDVEIILVLDSSISMRAKDIKPNRLDVAKREILNLKNILNNGDKISFFVFGHTSFVKSYITKDWDRIWNQVEKVNHPKTLIGDTLFWSTDFANILEHIYQTMDFQDAFKEGFSGEKLSHYIAKKRTNRIVILFSDGEDSVLSFKAENEEEIKAQREYKERLSKVLLEYRKRGLKIYPVGIGTETGVSWLSLLENYKKDLDYEAKLEEEWAGKVSRLDKNNLNFLARSTGVILDRNDWIIKNHQTNVKKYLEYVINSNRKYVSVEFINKEQDQKLWQYYLLIAAFLIFLGIITYPISGYFRK
jgi:hypothetical protein